MGALINAGKAVLGLLTGGGTKMTTDVFDKEDGLLVKAGRFIDEQQFTAEEKAKLHFKMADQTLDHVKTTNEESTDKSLTRRSMAVKWINMQIYLILLTAICAPMAVLSPEHGKQLFDIMFQLTTSWLVGAGTVTILAFFFGTYGYGTYMKGKTPKIKT